MSPSTRLTRSLAGAMAATALLAPAAVAAPAPEPGGNRAPAELAPTVTRTIDEGFDVGSAAVGAGGAVAVVLLATGGMSAIRNRHRGAPVRGLGAGA
jgi:hypothetical protein